MYQQFDRRVTDPALTVSATVHLYAQFRPYGCQYLQGIIASLIQLFFAWRVHVLTRSWWLVSLVLAAAISGGGTIPHLLSYVSHELLSCGNSHCIRSYEDSAFRAVQRLQGGKKYIVTQSEGTNVYPGCGHYLARLRVFG